MSGLDERRSWLLAIVADEFRHATEKHPPMHSPHEGWAVIKEELDELWKHVMEDTGRSALAGDEAIQIAAMALRYVYDLLTDQGPPLGVPVCEVLGDRQEDKLTKERDA